MSESPERNDRKRLEAEVHQTDLNESRLNEDFVDNLKQYGPWVLVAVLAVIAVRLWLVRAEQDAIIKRDTAWYELLTTTDPDSLEDVAIAWNDVDAVSGLARLQAGTTLLESVAADPSMTAQTRDEALAGAKAAFAQILAADDGARGNTVLAVNAMNGLAAVAESQGDAATAKDWYAKSQARAAGWLEPLADQARRRAETAEQAATPAERPQRAAAPALTTPTLPTPATGELQIKGDVPAKPAQTNPLGLPTTTSEDASSNEP